MNVTELVAQHNKALSHIRDYESALQDIRDSERWEVGVEKDTRPSVQLLWATLQEARAEHAAFCAQPVFLGGHPFAPPVLVQP